MLTAKGEVFDWFGLELCADDYGSRAEAKEAVARVKAVPGVAENHSKIKDSPV